jgi:hypothetical protein
MVVYGIKDWILAICMNVIQVSVLSLCTVYMVLFHYVQVFALLEYSHYLHCIIYGAVRVPCVQYILLRLYYFLLTICVPYIFHGISFLFNLCNILDNP